MKTARFIPHLVLTTTLAAAMTAVSASPRDWFESDALRIDPGLRSLTLRESEIDQLLSHLARIPKEQTGERLGYHSRITQQNTEPWVQLDLGKVQELDTVVIVPVVLPHEQGGIEGYGFPHRYRVEMSDDGVQFDAEHTVDFSQEDQPNPGRRPVVVPWNGRARYVRLTATRPSGRPRPDREIWPSLALAEIMVLHGDRNLAAGCPVTAPTSREAPPVWSVNNLTDSQSILGAPVGAESTPRQGYHSIVEARDDTPLALTFAFEQPREIEDVRLFPMQWEGYPHWLGFGFPVRFKVEISDDAAFTHAVCIGDFTQSDCPNPGMNPVVVPAKDARVRFVRITATKLWERFTDHALALSEVQIFSGGHNIAPEAKLDAPPAYPAKEWKTAFLVDGNASDNPIKPLPVWISELQRSALLEDELSVLSHSREARLRNLRENSLLVAGVAISGAFLAVLAFAWRSIRLRKQEVAALRERIARDLHDEVGSNLAGIALLSREASQMDTPQRESLLDDIRRIAEETAGSMRDLVWMIQPSAPGDLVGAFRQCAERMLGSKALRFEPAQQPLPARLSIDFKRQLYLIYREALQNVAKHSHARCVTIAMQREGSRLALSVRDDGVGFSTSGNNTPPQGFGLENMQQRAKQLRGRCVVTSSPGQGTEVRIEVPCA